MKDQRTRIIRHLEEAYREPVRDPVWGSIGLSAGLLRIAEDSSFQQLARIMQLGPTALVYPGATHTRLSHSFGVFHIAWRMIRRLLSLPADPPVAVTLEGVKAFLCAALLHDIGHYPYAHSLKDLELRSHESLAAERISSQPLAGLISAEVGVAPGFVAAIVDPGCAWPAAQQEVRFFRNLLSGVLDPDKLDYLNRDAYYCGVPYGIQDVDFVLAELLPRWPEGLGITPKGLPAVENVLFSKYLMYRSVYWHKTVRIATAMIKKPVLMGLMAGVLAPEDLYWIDDRRFYDSLSPERYAPFALVRAVFERALYKEAFAVPFDSHRAGHRALESPRERVDVEAEIAREASRRCGGEVTQEQIIIDVPEPISFEVDLTVAAGEGSGPGIVGQEGGGVFSREVVRGFTRSLRMLRLITPARRGLARCAAEILQERL